MINERFERLMNDPVMRATINSRYVDTWLVGYTIGVAMLQFGGLGGVAVLGVVMVLTFLIGLDKEGRLLEREKQVDKR